jgi:3-hydroxy-9,10-secoandrosta-1,3,5(10)-triene-9,17-dione monooxygenase reductase component
MNEDVVVADDAARFRQILGSFPTGVTVVTTLQDGRPVGMAAGSFFSVSLDPPLVGFCVMTTSNTWPAIERSGSFGVSILADDQTEVCRRLASKEPNKFDGLAWSAGPVTQSPLLDGAVAHLDCDLEQQHLAGDHWIVVGRVRSLNVHRDDAEPLVFCRGGFGRQSPL